MGVELPDCLPLVVAPPGLWYDLELWKVPMADSNPHSIFDTPPDAAVEARLDAEAEADYAAGRIVPHSRVREWLQRLMKGERVPPPEA
jgi:hypothetical protein